MAKAFSRHWISRCVTISILCILNLLTAVSLAHSAGPLRVNPSNPRYFVDADGAPVYLAGTYPDHEQLALGLEDFGNYLDFLQSEKHNLTRLWAWEQTPTTAKSPITTLPYLRTGSGQALDGGAKFDLLQFNQNYFDQLRARILQAAQRGVWVSVVLFETLESSSKKKQDKPWYRNPFNRGNNVNGVNGDPDGNGTGNEAYNLTIPAITSLQEAYIRKVVDTLNDLDNVLYELSGDGSLGNTAWQNYIITYLKNYEATKAKQHPVGVSYSYGNETDDTFAGPADWIIAYGADLKPPLAEGGKVLFLEMNPRMLNHSTSTQGLWKAFTRGFNVIAKEFDSFSPGISESLHTTIAQLVAYSEILNLARITPSNTICSTHYCLANAANEYLIYLPSGNRLTVDLSTTQQDFLRTWFDPKSGQTIDGDPIPGGSQVTIQSPLRGPAMLHMVQTNPLPTANANTTSTTGSGSKKTTVATPTITPNGGPFVGSTSVSIKDSTSGASIYFTTDGTTPSQSSTQYTAAITISSNVSIKARAFKTNANPSAIVSVTFTKSNSFDFSLTNSGNVSVVAGDFVNETINANLVTGSSQAVTFSASSLPTGASASFSAGTCNPTCSTVLRIQTNTATPTGNFPITVTSTGGGITRTSSFTLSVTSAVLPTAATPTITPNSGNFTNSTTVSIATSTSGAAIYYTINGSSPTQSSTLYTGAITLTASAIVKAKAFKSGYNPSAEASASFTSNLVGYWKFDEGSGTTTADSSGNGNTGTLTNGPLWMPGRLGNALYFDGVDDTVIVPDASSLDLSNAFTLSAWVNPSQAFTDFRSILVKNYSYYLYASVNGYCGDGTPLSGFEQSSSNVVCQSTSLVPNTWNHLAATYNGSTLTFYRDGLPVAVANASGSLAPSAGSLQIAASQFGEYFKGMIDEVRIYKTALSDSEIQTVYQQESVGLAPTVAAPLISPNGGNYNGPVTIAMQTATTGAQIYYTTDGSTPTQSSTPYSGGMNVTSTKTIKAKAFKNGYNGSGETDASFVISQPFSFSLTNSGNQSVAPGASVTNTVSTTLDSGASQTVSFSVSGLPAGATASFSLPSCSPACSTVLNITTAASTTTGSFSITVSSSGGNVTKTTMFTLVVSAALTVATPTITPNGGNFASSVLVSIQSTTPGASIYYSTDGSTPSLSSYSYAGPMELTSSATVKAIAFKSGYTQSLVAAAAFTNTASSASYYVGKTGSDSYSCSQAHSPSTPKLTIGAALACIGTGSGAGAGQIVEVSAGTYNEHLVGNLPGGSSWSSPFTLRAKSGDVVTIKPTSSYDLPLLEPHLSYTIVQDFILDGTGQTGVMVRLYGSYVRLLNTEWKNIDGDSGIFIANGAHDNEIIGGSFHDGRFLPCPTCTGGDVSYPIYVEGYNNLIEGVKLYNFPRFGIHINNGYTGSSDNNIIRQNIFHNGSTTWASGSAVIVYTGTGNMIYNNIVYGMVGHGLIIRGTNSAVYNNTVYGGQQTGIYVYPGAQNTTIKNNIAYANSTVQILDQGTATFQSNNLATNPQFVSPSSANFRLQSGSPAIDAGVNLSPVVTVDMDETQRPKGAGFDIGAYEY